MGCRYGKSKHFTLEGTIGYEGNHPAIPQSLDLNSEQGLACALSESAKRGEPTLFTKDDGILVDALLYDIDNRAFGDQCTAFVVIPVQPASKETISGFLIVGMCLQFPNNGCGFGHGVQVCIQGAVSNPISTPTYARICRVEYSPAV